MSFAQEKLEDSLRRLRVRQDLADARLGGLEAGAAEAAVAPPSGSVGAMPESALFQGLGRYAHWKPPAFAVWWVSGGGGRVGVGVPEGCVSWDGEPFPASAFSPAPQEDREMRVHWCEVPPPEAPRTVLFAAVVAPFDRTAGKAGDPDEVRLVWAESEAELRGRLDTESRHVAAAVPVAEYDPAGDRLVQVHVGALALGGGGGGGGSVVPDDVSTEFIPDPPDGTQPDGDEGKLQIKDWKNVSHVDPNSLADYSQGVAAIPQNGIQVVARFPQTGSSPLLSYIPLGLLFQDKSGQTPADMTVEFVTDVSRRRPGEYVDSPELLKRLRVLNLRTGAVSDKQGTTYANGWERAARLYDAPGNFEPVFAEDQSDHKTKLIAVGTGFYPFGRLFYNTVSFDNNSANIDTGYIYLEVNHPVSAQTAPTVYVKGSANMPDFANSNDTSKSLIPLYYIDGGHIEIDFRSCMSLTIREL